MKIRKNIILATAAFFCSVTAMGTPSTPAPDSIDAKVLFTSLLDLDYPGMERVRDAVRKGDLDAAAEEYLVYRRTVSTTRPAEKMPAKAAVPAGTTDPAADSVCAHYLKDNLNPHPYIDGWVFMGEEFDWNFNPRDKSDPAFSTEWTWGIMSRMKFLGILTQAYRKTLNGKYVSKASWFVRDFLRDNPLKAYTTGSQVRSKLWRTLDVAIRTGSLVNAYFTFRDDPAFTPQDQEAYSILIYLNSMRLNTVLLNNRERTGNHVTTECIGLFKAGSIFPEFRDAAQWRNTALERYSMEIARVVPPDGLQAELSPSYHYGTIASYKGIYDLARLNGIALPDGFTSKLLDMYRAPVLIMDQSGNCVRTNDSNPRDVRKMSKAGLEVADDPLLLWAASRGKRGEAPPASTALEYAGFYAMRSGWKRDDMFLFFRGGPEGIGHAEQDMLQIVLRAWDKTLLFDPGKYIYDQSQWRRYSINTPSHNTVTVDGKWQHREKKPLSEFRPTGNPWIVTPLFDYVAATYKAGYETNIYDPSKQYRPEKWAGDRDTSVRHTRKVLYLKPYYAIILDELQGTGRHTFDAFYHMDAPAYETDTSAHAVFSKREDGVQIGVYPLERNGLSTEIFCGSMNPMLGWMPAEHRPVPTVRFRKEQAAPASFATFLYPYNGRRPVFTAQNTGEDSSLGSWAYSIRTDEEEMEVFVPKGPAGSPARFASGPGGVRQVTAQGMVVRRPAGSRTVYTGGWGITSYDGGKLKFSAESPVTLVIAEDGKDITLHNPGSETVKISLTGPVKAIVALQPGTWNKVSRTGTAIVPEPQIFTPFTERR